MGFIPHHYNGMPDSWEYQPVAGDIAVSVGTGLVWYSGKLELATGANTPAYISMEERGATAEGEVIAVIRVNKNTEYETELSENNIAITSGFKYTIDETGGKITSASTSGVAEVISYDGKFAGAKVRVRF